MDCMTLEEKVPRAHDTDAVDVGVVGALHHDHDLLVAVSYRLQKGDLALPGLACEHLVSRLHVEHAPVLRRDEADLIVFYSPFGDGEKGAAPVKVWRRYSQVWRSEA